MNLAIGKCVNINGDIVKPIISNNCENCALIPCDEVRKLYGIKYCFIGNRPIKFEKESKNV